MDVVFLIIIGTVIILVLIYAIVSHKKRRAKILELRRQIREEALTKTKTQTKTTRRNWDYRQSQNDNLRSALPLGSSKNDDDDYEYLRALKEERDAYDDYIASLDMS
jgi:hypothetical protein